MKGNHKIMKKTSETHFDASGNATARVIFAADESVLKWDFTAELEKKIFGYFREEFSSIADDASARIFSKRKKHTRPLILSVALRRSKLKKHCLTESVSCDIGAKNLYKSRVIHVFSEVGGELVYRGTRKKTNVEKSAAPSNI